MITDVHKLVVHDVDLWVSSGEGAKTIFVSRNIIEGRLAELKILVGHAKRCTIKKSKFKRESNDPIKYEILCHTIDLKSYGTVVLQFLSARFVRSRLADQFQACRRKVLTCSLQRVGFSLLSLFALTVFHCYTLDHDFPPRRHFCYRSNMDETTRIPIVTKPASMMEVGPNGNNLASVAASRHPVDDLQRKLDVNPFQNLEYVRHVYGSGLAMRLATEQKVALEQERGAAGLPSSGLYRDIVTGNDVKLDFADFLSLPEYRPDVATISPHATMERRLGM